MLPHFVGSIKSIALHLVGRSKFRTSLGHSSQLAEAKR
jgi:hypothetical protein